MAATKQRPARAEPARRPLTGPTAGSHLVDRDPEFHYVFVSPEKIGEYENIGYQQSRFKGPGTVRPATWKGTQGSVMQWMGLTLMELPKEEHDRIEREGLDGQSGQQLADMFESSMRAQDGPTSRGIRFVNETQAPIQELLADG